MAPTTDPVIIADHDPRWPDMFAAEKSLLAGALGQSAVSIEHIGSTAVPGLAAKPVIDILVGVRFVPLDAMAIGRVVALGYTHKGENGIKGRHYFRREPRTHQVHLVKHDSQFWREHLLFRDYLRSRPAEAERYAVLKCMLAHKFRNDRDAYGDGKAPLIAEILENARKWNWVRGG